MIAHGLLKETITNNTFWKDTLTALTHNPISTCPTIPSPHVSQSHLHMSYNPISTCPISTCPTIPSPHVPQSHLHMSHNPISTCPTIPSTHVSQSHLMSHNPISCPTITSPHVPQSHLHNHISTCPTMFYIYVPKSHLHMSHNPHGNWRVLECDIFYACVHAPYIVRAKCDV